MRKPELSRITSALRGLTPMQRRVVAAELASLDAQPVSTVIVEGRFAAKVADALHIYISTAHRWRHRFLSLPMALQPQALTEIAEADETIFLLSFKGKRSGRAAKRGLSHEQICLCWSRGIEQA